MKDISDLSSWICWPPSHGNQKTRWAWVGDRAMRVYLMRYNCQYSDVTHKTGYNGSITRKLRYMANKVRTTMGCWKKNIAPRFVLWCSYRNKSGGSPTC